jgi:tetratricopeptide (TPR) repeat protein
MAVALGGCEEKVEKTPADLVADGWKLFRVGDYEHGVKAFEQAIQMSGSNVAIHQQALYGLATTWNLRRPDYKRDLAAKLYQEALDLAPDSDTAAWILLAQARMKHIVPPGEDSDLDALRKLHSDYGPIREAYQKVIDRFPEHPAGHEAFLYQQGTYVTSLDAAEARQAIAAIEAFLAKHPTTGFASAFYVLLGNAHLTLGEYADHLASAIKALETRPIDPTNPKDDYAQPYYEVACVAEFEVGDFATARKYYQKLIDEYPVDVRGAAARAALKRMDKVEAMARAGQPFADFDAAEPQPSGEGSGTGRPAADSGAPKGAGS